jgi:Flp pilus assembly secretin CpaC
MLRTLGSVTLVLGIMCTVAALANAGEAKREKRREDAGNANKPDADAHAARMVMIEVLIADVRRGEAGKGDAGNSPGDPKARIQQLDKAGKLESLTCVQLTTVDGQKASLHVGQRIPRITGSQRGPTGQVNSIAMENVGMMLAVTPQIPRDGPVIMSIGIERSQLGPAEEGTPIAKPSEGETIRAASLETLTTQSTIAARDGQSVAVAFQQTKRKGAQNELLIVVTPQLLGNEPPASAK